MTAETTEYNWVYWPVVKMAGHWAARWVAHSAANSAVIEAVSMVVNLAGIKAACLANY